MCIRDSDDPDEWIFDTDVEQHTIEKDGKTYRRDPDVFDTWFSSGQWPMITTNYPDHDDFSKYYPTSLMETGGDILYQWVSRMICLGLYVTGDVPFKEVYLHGMVRSEDGRKMSKSLGNVVDPMPIIAEHGTDTLRMGMIVGRSAGDNAAFSPAKIVSGRNFCNKLWNIARFSEAILEDAEQGSDPKPRTAADHWILHRLDQTIKNLHELMAEYRLSEAYELAYHFVWDDLADWYIEASKHDLTPSVLRYVLQNALILVHPFAPFVSETIWQTLDWVDDDSSLISQQLPQKVSADHVRAQHFSDIQTIVLEARKLKKELNLRNARLFFKDAPFLQNHASLIQGLSGVSSVQQVADGKGLNLVTTQHNCWLDIDATTAHDYIGKLEDELMVVDGTVRGLKARLDNDSYVKKAPKKLVDDTRQQLHEAEATQLKIRADIDRYSAL